ncbi:alpha/beta fold hydrolase [Plantactinospora siamensis]|uniref:Alpha/beta fold hydrolase n=1 Tax=Plantactinospora siamensis TaxID=555372 RepID=A0ABV6P3L7_9ACTN
MADLVLVPGFWLGAWAWAEVAGRLRAAGHRVFPVTLTGLAERAGEATPEVDVDTHVGDVIRVIEDNALRNVVLVAHSGANVPVTMATDRIPDRLARVVYVEGGPMPDGMAQIDFDPGARDEVERLVRADGDGWRIPVPPFDDPDDPNLAGLSEAQRALLRERGTPQPFGTATQPVRRPADLPEVPVSVVACTFRPDVVRQLADGGHPVFALMAGAPVHHLPTGHWPMLSRPADLADLLSTVADGAPSPAGI